MRLVFAAIDNYGHVYPIVPLALAAQQAGHDVLVVTGEHLAPQLERAGLRVARPLPSALWAEGEVVRSHPELADSPKHEKVRFAFAMFGDVLARRVAHDLLPLLREEKPDAVVLEAYSYGAALAAWLHGVPAVVHSLNRPWPLGMWDPLRAAIEPVWRELGGTGPLPDVFAGDVYVEICPPLLRDPSAPQPPRVVELAPTPWSTGGDVPAWVREPRDRPLAYVTLGTVVFEAVDALRAAASGLVRSGYDVLAAVGPAGDVTALDGLGERVHVERFVAQEEVLRHCDLVVSHAGSGTLLGALAHGRPQLALPQGADQFANAQIVADSGVGIALMPDQITAESVEAAVRRLRDEPSYAAAAATGRDQIAAMPTPADAVPALVDAVAAAR